MTTPTITTTDRIGYRFHMGENRRQVIAWAEANGMTVADVDETIRVNEWDLNDRGYLPVPQRRPTPLGLAKLPPGPLVVRPAAERGEPTPAKPPKPAPKAAKVPSVTKRGPTPKPRAPRSNGSPAAQGRPAAPKRGGGRGGPKGVGSRGMVREHGSVKGYGQHYRCKDLPVCQACKDAWNEWKRTRREHSRLRPPGRDVGRTLESWLEAGQRHRNPDIARAAANATGALMALRIAIDALHAAERRAQQGPFAHDHPQEMTA